MTTFRVLDFESTDEPGDDKQAGIIEFGYTDVVLDDDGIRMAGSRDGIVKSPLPVSVQARAVHHISDAEIAEGMPLEHALLAINGAEVDYFVAHNADFERQFFSGGEKPWICSYKVAVRAWPDAPRHSNQVLRYWRNLQLDHARTIPPHRALPDSYVTAGIFIDLYLDLVAQRGRALKDLVKVSNMPPMPHVCGFGKHKGSKWKDLPADYLDWIAEKSDMDKDTKWLARQHRDGKVKW